MEVSPPLVFIHGIKGSFLEREGKRVYITVSQLLGLDCPDLSLPISWNESTNIQDRDLITPSEATQNVLSCFSKFLGAQVYGVFVSWARRKYGKEQLVHGWLSTERDEEISSQLRFFVFTYDWRRDNNENSQKLMNFLRKLNDVSETKPQVVAHSNGGLLLWNCINRNPELIHSAGKNPAKIYRLLLKVLAGVPFGTSLSFLKDMHVGVTNGGFNRRHLAPSVYFTFPCPYCYFPLVQDSSIKEDGTAYEDGTKLLKKQNGELIEFNFTDAAEWERLGIFFSNFETVTEEHRNFLQKCLDQAKKFREAQPSVQENYPPIAVLASDSYPTKLGAYIDLDTKSLDFDSWPPLPGDGRVTLNSAKPPAGCPFSLYKSSKPHGSLLDDTSLIEQILFELQS